MAADGGGLRRLFEKPLPENPTLLEALSACNHRIHSNKPIDTASFTEIFGELHFKEKKPPEQHRNPILPLPPSPPRSPLPPRATPSSSSSWVIDEADKSKDDSSLDALLLRPKASAASGVKRSASFCVTRKKSSASSLLLCTEGLGSESTVDADDMRKDDADAVLKVMDTEAATDGGEAEESEAAAAKAAEEKPPPPSFPPPIGSIGRGGKPCVCFRSVRAGGRFVLMEVVIPGKELLHAYRDGGRLRLQFANQEKGEAGNVFAAEEESAGAVACS